MCLATPHDPRERSNNNASQLSTYFLTFANIDGLEMTDAMLFGVGDSKSGPKD